MSHRAERAGNRLGKIASEALPLLTKSSWSILEQGMFAGVNFVLNILLARWLPPREYGAFTIAFSVFLLVGIFHTALLTEPMLVFGAGKFRYRFSAYVRTLLRGHAGFSLLAGAGLALAGVVMITAGSPELGHALVILAAAQPLILFLWLMRRICYMKLQPKVAVAGGAVYVVLVLAGTYVLYQTDHLSVLLALAIMGGASAVAGLWILRHYRPYSGKMQHVSMRRLAAREHWTYGRWAAPTGILTWVSSQFAAMLLAFFGGLEIAAAWAALMNLTLPVVHAYVAFSVLAVPVLVRAIEAGRFRKLVVFIMTAVVAGTCLYWLLLGLSGEPVMRWLYQGQYGEYAWALWIVGGLPVLTGIAAVLGAALRALERPDQIFWSYLGSSLAALILGTGLIYSFGFLGAVAGKTISLAIGIGIMLYLVRDRLRRRPTEAIPTAKSGTRPMPVPLSATSNYQANTAAQTGYDIVEAPA